MRKRNRKLISVLLTLSLLVAMLVPMVGPASAATTNLVTATPTVLQNVVGPTLGQVWMYENSDQAGSVFPTGGGPYDITVTLLTNGVEFNAVPTVGVNEAAFVADLASLTAAGTNTIAAGDINFVANGTAKTYTVRITPTNVIAPPAVARSGLQFMFPVNIAGGTPGPIEVEISAPDTGITGGKFVIGNIAGTGTNTVVLDTGTIQIGSTASACGLFRIEESVVGSLAAGNQIRVDLPADMTWNAATTVTAVGVTLGAVTTNTFSAGGNSRLVIPIAAPVPPGGSRGMITISPSIDVDDDCVAGDISLSVSGNSSNVTSANVVIGTVADYGVKVEAVGDPKNIIAGAIDQEISPFKIIEGVNGSLLGNRTVLVELPSYVRWFSDPTLTTEKGTANLLTTVGNATTDDSRHTKKYTVAAGGSASATTIKFERCRVYVDADAPEGDVKVTFSGTGGLSGELVLAKVVKPVTATGGNDKVIIGMADQAAADVVITEGLKGVTWGNPTIINNAATDRTAVATIANNQGWIVVDAPDGVTFAQKPTVEVIEGNIRIDKEATRLQANDNQFAIRVTNGSTSPSKIKLSNIKLTLDRTVPEGQLKLSITGTAVDKVSQANDVAVDKVVVANVATPAPSVEKANAVFTIGQSTFTLNGTEVTMDVAPYLKNDRTYMPIRYVAQALGVSDSNIMWNGEDQSVVLIKGDRVVKLVIGSTTMLMNGVPFTMDVAPELVDPGRTMLPLRWVAQALGAQVDWDEATQSVTVK